MSNNKKEVSRSLDPSLDFLAGTVGGIAGLIVGHPLDTVKVRLQTPGIAPQYRNGTLQAVKTIYMQESFGGLYKGVTSPLAGTAFLNGMLFASYGLLLRLQGGSSSEEPSLKQVAIAGAGSGIVASLVTTPIDLVKIRQQTMLSRHGLPSTPQVVAAIIRSSGIRGLYTGLLVTCFRDAGYGVYFATYEASCRFFRLSQGPRLSSPANHLSLMEEAEGYERSLSWPSLMISGGLAGLAGWLCTFPLDVIKSQIQASNSETSPRISSLLVECYRSSGVRGLFAGVSPTIMRAFPVNMMTFLGFEVVVALANGGGSFSD